MTKELMEQVLDALITYRDFIDNAHIIEGQFHWLEGTEDAIKALEEALKQEQETPFKNTKEKIMINQVLLCALKEYVNSDPVDVELNPRKRMAIEAIAEAEKQEQGEPVAYINVEQRKLEWAKYTSWETPTVANLPKIPLYTKPQSKQEQDEPVCDKDPKGCWSIRCQLGKKCKNTPQTKEWVELTKQEYDDIYASNKDNLYDAMMIVATYLKRKNK